MILKRYISECIGPTSLIFQNCNGKIAIDHMPNRQRPKIFFVEKLLVHSLNAPEIFMADREFSLSKLSYAYDGCLCY